MSQLALARVAAVALVIFYYCFCYCSCDVCYFSCCHRNGCYCCCCCVFGSVVISVGALVVTLAVPVIVVVIVVTAVAVYHRTLFLPSSFLSSHNFLQKLVSKPKRTELQPRNRLKKQTSVQAPLLLLPR